MANKPKPDVMLSLRAVLATQGDLSAQLEDSDLKTIGSDVVREAKLDDESRKDWLEGAKRYLETASQKPPPKKTTPFDGAANVQYPVLTVACIQFAARAYPAIVRGDEVLLAKISGEDEQGQKAKRADRTSSYANDQLCYQMDEWEPGVDALLHHQPATGMAFKMVYWDAEKNRPVSVFVPGTEIIVSNDTASIESAPRITQILKRYPHEIEKKVASGFWGDCDYDTSGDDSQALVTFYQQFRYIDMDGDGVSEPYVVTVHEETEKVVRIEAAFDAQDIKQGPKGIIIEPVIPYVDFPFLPDPEGGFYGMGFGRLLEVLTATINTSINQMIDAGTWANSKTGFIATGLRPRGGDIELEPGRFPFIEAAGGDIAKAIYEIEFEGPNPVLFQLVEFLLGAAKDITAVKDVLTGDAPNQQPATSTLALIEQGLQVFTSIYKRIYRSMRQEFRLLFRLNARYLDQETYLRFLDWRPPQQQAPGEQPAGMGHNGGPELTEADMAPPDPRRDFDLFDMDVRPVADPTAVTEMQRLAKAQFLQQFGLQYIQDPTVDQHEIKKRVLEAARISDIDKILPPQAPALQQMMAKMVEQMGQMQATIDKLKSETTLNNANAEKATAEAKEKSLDAGIRLGELEGMAGASGHPSGDGAIQEPGDGEAGPLASGELAGRPGGGGPAPGAEGAGVGL